LLPGACKKPAGEEVLEHAASMIAGKSEGNHL